MSVLVKGIEMPKNCYDCPFIRASVAGDYYCVAGDGIEEDLNKLYERRMSDCPLVDSPEPHWIPVTERLPEKGNTAYLATLDYGEYGMAVGQRFFFGDNIGWNDKSVVAWMPLPKPMRLENK